MLPLTLTLGAWYTTIFTIMFIFVCLFLMLVILIQKPRGGGLSGAFGGAGGSATSVFGAKTGDVLTWFTVVCFCLFIGLAMLLTWTAKPERQANVPILNTKTNPVPPASTDGGAGAGTTTDSAGKAPATTDGDAGKAADSATKTPATTDGAGKAQE